MTIQGQADQTPTNAALPKVSVVDDDPDLLTFFKDLADTGRFVLLGAYTNGREALAQIPQCPPDIVFMDLRLPDMSGIDCTKRLMTILPDLSVVVLTGHPDHQTFVRAFMAGAKGFLTKPCSVEETLAAIKDVLSNGVVLGKAAVPYLQRIFHQLSHLDQGWKLTDREKQILACIFEGKSDKQIANALKIRAATVHTHMSHLFEKLGVHSRDELIARFLQP